MVVCWRSIAGGGGGGEQGVGGARREALPSLLLYCIDLCDTH